MNNLIFLKRQTETFDEKPVRVPICSLQNKISSAMNFFGQLLGYANQKCAANPGSRFYAWPGTHDAPFMDLMRDIVSEFSEEFPEQCEKMEWSLRAIRIFLDNAPKVRLSDKLLACIVSVLWQMSRSVERKTGIKPFTPFFASA